ncbi:O-antigen export protein [Enteractinococcus coprophilus]
MDKIPAIVSANRILLSNITGTAVLRGVAILLSLAAMPAYLSYFSNSAVLGTWFTVLSLLTFLSFFDFGVGNGLRNNVAQAMSDKEHGGARELISAGYHLAFVVMIVVAALGYLTIHLIDWQRIFDLENTNVGTEVLELTLVIVLGTVCVQLFLRNAISILYGLQRMVIAHTPALATSTIILIFLLFGGTGNTETDLLRLASIFFVATVAPLLVVHIGLFSFIIPGMHPRWKTSLTAMRRVGGLGLGFFAVQLALLVVQSTDQILITTVFSSADVVDYQVHLRVFTVVTMAFQLLTQPFWSAVTSAAAEGKKSWIGNAARTLYLIAAGATLMGLVLVPLLQSIFNLWLGPGEIVVVWWQALAFVLLVGVQLFMYAGTTIANGTGALRPQMVWMPVAAIMKIPLAYILSLSINTWAAIVIAHALVMIPLVLAQTRALKKAGYLGASRNPKARTMQPEPEQRLQD